MFSDAPGSGDGDGARRNVDVEPDGRFAGLIALQIHRGAMIGSGKCITRCAVDGGMAMGMGYMFSLPVLPFGWARLVWIGYFGALAIWQLGLAVRLVPAVREYERSAHAWAAQSSQDHPTPRLVHSICQLGWGRRCSTCLPRSDRSWSRARAPA